MEFVRDGFDDFDLFETCEEYYDEEFSFELIEDPIPEWEDLIQQ